MNKSFHIALALLILFFLLVLADLIPFWMPMMGEMLALLVVTVLLLVWAGFVLKEHAQDEREVVLKMKSGRIAYLSGMGVLLLALVVQGLEHAIDPWITFALAVMVLAKLVTRFFLD